jgi:hypothetical protein
MLTECFAPTYVCPFGGFGKRSLTRFRVRQGYKMTRATSMVTIHAPAHAIWQVIGDFGAACQYLARVIECTVEGEGIGARRTLTSTDGSTIVERLEALDEIAHRLSYALLTDTPFRNCLTTMIVRDLGPSQAELEWLATFEAGGLPADEARDMLEAALVANCLALKQFMEAGRT